ncbi:MAG: transglutaminase family protein [Rubripirellula sp.]
MFESLHRHLSRRQLLSAGTAFAACTALSQESGSFDPTDAAEPDKTATDGGKTLSYQSPQIQHWRIGLVLNTPVTCTGVLATFPIPKDWPEQKVTLVDQTVDSLVSRWQSRELAGGAKQIVLQMDRVPAGSTVELTLTFKVERSRIVGPELTEQFIAPKRPSRELRLYMGNSPFIDASNSRIKAASRTAKLDAKNDWEQVEQIYDYVRDNVEYVEGTIKNASQALKDGTGDCEEMTSLFVAMCRNASIPARMVWIPDHCYPEFYLEDANGEGTWFPCQAAGTRQFGRMDEYRPVLQKGDRFTPPETKKKARYVSEFFRCDKQGKGNPRPNFIREMIEI